jgi:hypothetical protein
VQIAAVKNHKDEIFSPRIIAIPPKEAAPKIAIISQIKNW